MPMPMDGVGLFDLEIGILGGAGRVSIAPTFPGFMYSFGHAECFMVGLWTLPEIFGIVGDKNGQSIFDRGVKSPAD